MSKNYFRKYNGHVFRKMLRNIVLGVISVLLLSIFVDRVLNGLLVDFVSIFSWSAANFITRYSNEIILSVLLIVMVALELISQFSFTRKLNSIIDSIDVVFNKEETLIKLPKDFKEIEDKLNSIKYENVRNEQLAKEAEQRKNDLVVYLAHDLKTPLTSVIGYLTLLNDEQEISEELRKKYLSISLNKAERLEELINEFFEITRFNLQNITLERSQINLSMMLRQLAEEFYPVLAERELECKVTVGDGLFLWGDADKLARVFDNLLRNAIAYSFVKTSIEIFASSDGRETWITFQNHGHQIPEHKLNTIFEKFYRLDSARSSKTGGAGLGLAIAKEIVELHNGRIHVSSTPECTAFTVTLPCFV